MLENLPKKNQNSSKKEKKTKTDFNYIKELFENYPMSYSFEEILNEKFGEDNDNFEKQELRREYSEYLENELKKEELRQKYAVNPGYYLARLNLNQEQTKIFNDLANTLTHAYITKNRNDNVRNNPLKYTKKQNDFEY